MIDTLKMFDYWSFPKDGTVQFFQVCEGHVIQFIHYDRVEDAPIALIGEGPQLRYHGRAYDKPIMKAPAKPGFMLREQAE